MTATAHRVFHEQESAGEHVRNALQLLRLGQDVAAVDDRLVAALEKIEATERRLAEAEARVAAAIDLDGARLSEIDALRNDLRERLDFLAGFQESDRPHLYFNTPRREYRVVRSFIREYVFTDWNEAKGLFKSLCRAAHPALVAHTDERLDETNHNGALTLARGE